MDRSPAFLAALASAAVPGLHPVSVEALPSTPDQSFDVGFVEDAEHRRWVVRAPRSDVAGAEMDLTVALLGLLARRLPFAVPAPKGFVELKEGGRAAVYPYLPGRNLDFAELPAGPGIAAELGRAIAALHNTDLALFDEAGLPWYDADAYRSRRLADLDRAAQTGRVPPPCSPAGNVRSRTSACGGSPPRRSTATSPVTRCLPCSRTRTTARPERSGP